MQIQRLSVGPLEANCWVVGDAAEGPLFVVDPGADADAIIDAVGGRRVEAILLTHAHFDHVGAVDSVRSATGAWVGVHSLDSARLQSAEGTGAALFGMTGHVSAPPERAFLGGETLAAGTLAITVLHTPGHSGGGVCYLFEAASDEAPHLFSGDTLFAGSVGRTDFVGGDARELQRSILTVLANLPMNTVVHPGHGPDTTIGRESRVNPFWPRG